MRFFSTRHFVIGGLLFALALILFFTWFTYRNVKKEEKENSRVSEALAVLRLMEKLMDDMQDIETGQRGYIISGNTTFLDPYNSAVISLQQDTAALRTMATAYPSRKEKFLTLLDLVKRKMQFIDSSIALRQSEGFSEAAEVIISGKGKRVMDSIRLLIGTTEEEGRHLLRTSNAGRELAAKRNARLFTGLAALFIVTLFFLYYLIRQSLRRERSQEKQISYLARLVESSGDAIISCTIDFIVVSWNKAAEELYGYSREEVIGQHFLHKLQSRPDENKTNEIISSVISTGIYKGEFDYITKSGQTITVLSTVGAIKNSNNQLTGFVIVHRDITERKQIEARLKTFTEELAGQVKEKTKIVREVFERMSDAIVAFDTNWVYTYVNSKAEQLLNKPPGSLIGKHLWTEFPELLKEPFYKFYIEAMEKQEYRWVETYYADQDRWFENHIYPSETGLSIYFKDITEKKKAELKLQQALDRFNIVANATNDVIWEADLVNNTIWWNENFYEKFGYPRQQELFRGDTWDSLLHPDDKERVLAGINKAIEDPGTAVWTDEYRFRLANGNYANIYDRCYIMRDGTGKAYKIVGSMTDVSILMHTREMLRVSEERYRVMVGQASDAIFINDIKGQIEEVNGKACELLGYRPDELTQMNVSDLFLMEDLQKHPIMFDTLLKGETTFIERNMRKKNGDLVPVEITARLLPHHRIIAIVRDVTERKKAQEQIAASEKSLRHILSSSAESFYVIDRECRIILINEIAKSNLEKAWGYPVDVGTNILEHIPSDTSEPIRPSLDKVFAGEKVEYELHLFLPDLPEWVVVNYLPVYDEDNNVTGAFISTRDITARKKAEEALRKSEAQLSLIYNTTSDVIFLIGIESGGRYRYRSVNDAFLQLTGLKRESVEGKYIEEVIPAESIALIRQRYDEIVNKKLPLSWEETSHYPSGPKTGIDTVTPVLNDAGDCIMLVGAIHDITDRKKAEEELLKSREDFASLVNSVDGIVWEADAETLAFSYVSKKAEQILGYPVKQWLTEPSFWQNHLHPDDRNWVVKECTESTRKRQSHQLEYRMIHAAGHSIWVRDIVSVTEEPDKPLRVRGIIIDITERKKTEEVIRDSEEKRRLIINAALDAIIGIDAAGKVIAWNPQAEKIFGWSEDETLGKKLSLFIIPERYREAHDKGMTRYLSTGEGPVLNRLIELQAINKKGAEFPIELSIVPVLQHGQTSFTAFIRDITERKKASEALRQAAERFSSITSATHDALWEWNFETGELWANEQHQLLYGLTKNDPVPVVTEWENRIHPDDRQAIIQAQQVALQSGINYWESEYRFKAGEGNYVTLFDRCYIIRNKEGKAIRLTGSMIDISSRKKAEEEVAKARDMAEKMIDALPGVFYFYDHHGRFIRWNKEFERVTGYSADEIASMHPTQFFPDEEKEYIAERIATVFEKGANDAEASFLTKDGRKIPHYFKAVLLQYEGKPCLLGSGIDISERKKAEEDLRASEKKYKLLFDNNPMPMWMLSLPDMNIIDVNESAVDHYGYSRKEFLSMNAADMRPAEEVRRFWAIANQKIIGVRYSGIWKHRKKDGSVIDVEVIAHDIFYEDKPTRLILAKDVTEKVRAEALLKKSFDDIRELTEHLQTIREEERAHIAREIHDELGQQLTVLKMDVSWLNKKIQGDEAVKLKLKELAAMLDGTVKTVRRISSELRPSLLDDLGLVAAMEWHLRDFEKRTGVEVIFKEPGLELDISESNSTGLFRIFQESLTNVARHANASMVEVQLTKENGTLILRIQDNGKGFNKEKDANKRTLGILGMKERTLMMGGHYEISSKPGKGTTVIVTVPLNQLSKN